MPGPTEEADASCPHPRRLSVCTGRCCGEPRCPQVVHGPARGTDRPKCHQPAQHPQQIKYSVVHLVQKQSQILLSHPLLPGPSWDFHNR